MRVVFNRSDPPQDSFFPATFSEDVWRSDAFDRLTGKRPSPNVKALDDALIETVSFWKRAIKTDMSDRVGLPQISAFINSVILVRALEDYRNRVHPTEAKLLVSTLGELPATSRNAGALIRRSLSLLGQQNPPEWLQEILVQLSVFNAWDVESLRELVSNFYRSRYSPYRYNFNLISKHALSRIYEHYVSILRDNGPSDLTLFRDLPEELRNKDLGSVYTPQYIARFFARYLKEHRTPRSFRTLRTIDPACGSGMFLRTLLEMQCDPANEGFSIDSVRQSFALTSGIDIDPNACQATRLSLALLHLVLTGEFPETLNVVATEALEALQRQSGLVFDVIIANPPFVKWDGLPTAIRERITSYMLEQGFGKQDLYFAFLKSAMEHTAPGGTLCFVLPYSFLLAKSASKLRSQLSQHFAIRVLADLSEVPVFEETGVYVILLIAERTTERLMPATIVKCQEFIGAALQDAVAGRMRLGAGYQVFEVEQNTFQRERWQIVRSEETVLQSAIEKHPRLEQFAAVRQGVVTGADGIFIRPLRECPKTERDIWCPLLPDRLMKRFGVPERLPTAVFMPFDSEGERLTESGLRNSYPETWKYLREFRRELNNRSTVRNGCPWWEPARPRSPGKMLVPKVVTPHLVLLPRFGIDTSGKYAVSHCPYLVPKAQSGGLSLLKIMCAILNSAVGHWQLASTSHKYSRGYLMLEVKTLQDFHMPDPVSLSTPLIRRIVRLVDTLIATPDHGTAMTELDVAVGEAFGLSSAQMSLVGVDG
jgi:methylase of polypeptide subunit release factors